MCRLEKTKKKLEMVSGRERYHKSKVAEMEERLFAVDQPAQERALRDAQQRCTILADRVAQLSEQLAASSDKAAKFNQVGMQ